MAAIVEYFVLFIFMVLIVPYLWKRAKRRKRQERTKDCLLVFSRYPDAGTTKTRLVSDLGESGAAYCQLLMTEHILDKFEKLTELTNIDLEVELLCKGGSSDKIDYWLDRRRERSLLEWTEQAEGDLGNKMRTAVYTKFIQGKERVIVVGSDIPGISEHQIHEALRKLQSGEDMVLGRASDGGYYLVGFNKMALRYLDEIFVGIDWGTDVVFQQQMAKAKQLNANVEVLTSVLSDVDSVEDLPTFEKEIGICKENLVKWKWSVVIPTLNEADSIEQTLDSIIQNFSDENILADIVISDGGSQDKTTDIVKQYTKTCPISIRIVNSIPGRGFQLKAGADEASGDYFLFLHADTTLPPHYDTVASRNLRIPGNVAGAFGFGFDIFDSNRLSSDENLWFRLVLRIIQTATAVRCQKFELPYGDQGLFLSRKTYYKVGGYDEDYLMEDVKMVEKLRNMGHVVISDESPIRTSSRRWKKHGAVRITAYNVFLMFLYKNGVHPNTLARWYYGDKKLSAMIKRQ